MGTKKAPYEFNELEQRIWDLMGEGLTTFQIIDRLDMPPAEVAGVIRDIVHRRGTPGLEAVDRALKELRKIRFV